MKRIVVSIVSLLLLFSVSGAAQQLDSAKREALEAKLAEYFEALKYESLDVQKEEADFLIESTSDSLVRQFVACTVYDHFIDSPVMGSEAVAVHVYDRWFAPGKVKMKNDMDHFNARIFADFNRQSLIGEKAPELVVESVDGTHVELFTGTDKSGRYRVLFFYDADCAKCKLESIMLSNVLETEDFPIDFVAIYAGDNRQKWDSYVEDRLSFEVSRTKVLHLWDPTLDSDFQRKYGILQTPRMYLIRPDQVIKGRGLDTYALAHMLGEILSHPDLEYGNPQMDPVFDNLLVQSTETGVKATVDYLAQSQLHAGDTTMCRQLLGDFLYYLAPKTGQAMKEGTKYLIDEYILGRNDIWNTADDSLKVVGFAEIMDDLLSKSMPGSRIADIKVPGELLTYAKSTKKTMNLRKLKGESNLIIFHTDGCNICAAEIAAARKIISQLDRKQKNKIKVFLVNVDDIMASDPALASKLFDSFDLSSLPFIIGTDKKGIIDARYMTLRN